MVEMDVNLETNNLIWFSFISIMCKTKKYIKTNTYTCNVIATEYKSFITYALGSWSFIDTDVLAIKG